MTGAARRWCARLRCCGCVRSTAASEDSVVKAADNAGTVIKTVHGVVSHVDESVPLGHAKHRDLGDVAVNRVRPAGGGFMAPRFALLGADKRVVGMVSFRKLWRCVGSPWVYERPLAHVQTNADGSTRVPVDEALLRALEFAAR